jgi:hypothetical protein
MTMIASAPTADVGTAKPESDRISTPKRRDRGSEYWMTQRWIFTNHTA